MVVGYLVELGKSGGVAASAREGGGRDGQGGADSHEGLELGKSGGVAASAREGSGQGGQGGAMVVGYLVVSPKGMRSAARPYEGWRGLVGAGGAARCM
eukprot:286157-Chlamydomonas_euryale.AAC.1